MNFKMSFIISRFFPVVMLVFLLFLHNLQLNHVKITRNMPSWIFGLTNGRYLLETEQKQGTIPYEKFSMAVQLLKIGPISAGQRE